MKTISIPCEASLLPKPGDLVNIFNQITNLIAQLEMQGLADEAQKLRDLLDGIRSGLGNFPISISYPVFGTLDIPEVEWEKRINAMIEEYHLFIQAKFLEIISAVIPVSFAIPVPPFGISVDIVKLFSDPAYKSTIKAQFASNIDTFYDLLPDIYKSFDGTYGLESPDMKVEAVWEYVMTQLNKGALGVLHGLFGSLIDKFDTIWKALGLPALPSLTELNVQGLIESTIQSIEAQIKSAPADLKHELRKQAIDLLKGLQIVGFSILDLLGGEPTDFVKSLEREMDRFKRRIKNFGEEWPKFLIQEWMQKVQKFFKAIGLGALIEWITFTFCDFLKLIGLPSSVTIATDISLSSIVSSGAALPSLTAVATDMSGIYEFTTEEDVTEYNPARSLPITGSPTVILDNIELTESTDYIWNSTELSLTSSPLSDKKLLIIE